MKDIYEIDFDEVLDLVEHHHSRFSVLLTKNKSVLEPIYKTVPSWVRFQAEMVRRGKKELIAEIEDLDRRFWADKTQDEINTALMSNDIERLKALQLATQIMLGQDKLDNGDSSQGESQPIAMTINVSGVAGQKEKK